MSIRHLQPFFAPRSVAVVGASERARSVGFTLFQNLRTSGFKGSVWPVNGKRDEVQGVRAFHALSELPECPELVVVCTPAATVPQVVREAGQVGCRAVLIISAGFREAGEEGKRLEADVRAAAAEFDGLRIVGPNCLGVIAPHSGLNASFAATMPQPGHVAFVSQSGALCTAVLDWAAEQGLGFSCFASVGNMLDVGFDDLIDYLAADPQTQALMLYVESITQAREFLSAARAFTRVKPIVAYKAGRFAQSAQAAASHTGALAGVDAVYEAAFARAGIERVFEMEDLFDCAELLARQPQPPGGRLAIITNAGGPGVMATDALLASNGTLASLSPQTIERLNAALPPYWSHNNPIDVLGDAPAKRYAAAVEAVLADTGVDAVLVILTPQAMTQATETAQQVIAAAGRSRTRESSVEVTNDGSLTTSATGNQNYPTKPVLTVWMGGPSVAEARTLFHRANVPTYSTPEQAVRAVQHLVSFANRRSLLTETPRDVAASGSVDRETIRKLIARPAGTTGESWLLAEPESKALLAAYGIPVVTPLPAASAEQAVGHARQMGYPVVLKLLSPDITHKTDVGGVKLNLKSDREVIEAFEQILQTARLKVPEARLEGVSVQPMVTTSRGFELIVGTNRDPIFGPVILVGRGGVTAEVDRDRALELPPLNERLARRMLESLRSWPLLLGYRGRPGANVDRLIETLIRFSYLVADVPEIAELDINPLLATAEGVQALDARVLIRPPVNVSSESLRPFAHLAIHPYPTQLVRTATLKDGTLITLRPIQPEDEPLWKDMLDRSSPESRWFRFRHVFQHATHEMAVRYCFIDYDREMALVAELDTPAGPKLLGVGRLVSDVDHVAAEYAVMVTDDWQGRGVGTLLTTECLKIARDWGVRDVTAETTADNIRMQRVFERQGFERSTDWESGTVIVKKHIEPDWPTD